MSSHKFRMAVIAWMILGFAGVLTATAQVQISGPLSNFDVRYPPSQPNDLEIILYGDGLSAKDILSTWVNAFWGAPDSIEEGVNNDPTSPAFGLDCVIIRYKGPPLPNQVGQNLHFGVSLRPWAVVAHQEVWWTKDGVRLVRPCDPHITWFCTTRHWLICIANPTPIPIYIYGCRWFPIPTGIPLPPLTALNTGINPAVINQDWIRVPLPGGQPTLCIPPWCRIYIRIPITTWRPIVFQIAARNIPFDDERLPLKTDTEPDPQDVRLIEDPTGAPELIGTMAILTTRPAHGVLPDLTCDGRVNIRDVIVGIRPHFGFMSEDIFPPDPGPWKGD